MQHFLFYYCIAVHKNELISLRRGEKTVLPCAIHGVTSKSRFLNSDEFYSLVYTFTLFTVTLETAVIKLKS